MTEWEQKYNELQIRIHKLEQRNKELESTNIHKPNVTPNRHGEEFWQNIYDKMNRNPDYIKNLVKKKILTMEDTDGLGRTLLLVSAKYGSYNIAQFCLNCGADINFRELIGLKRDAITLAREFTNYHIEQLLLFSKLNADIGDEIRDTGNIINKQNGINENIINELSLIG
eukprot:403881_1